MNKDFITENENNTIFLLFLTYQYRNNKLSIVSFDDLKSNFPPLLVAEGGVRICFTIFNSALSSITFSLYLNYVPESHSRKMNIIFSFPSFLIHSPT